MNPSTSTKVTKFLLIQLMLSEIKQATDSKRLLEMIDISKGDNTFRYTLAKFIRLSFLKNIPVKKMLSEMKRFINN